MSKFEICLKQGAKEIREARAKLTTETAKEAAVDLVRKYTKERRELEIQLDKLTDLNRDGELSLKVVKDSFEPATWLREMHKIKCDIAIKEVEVQMAEEIYEEWFGDSPIIEEGSAPTPTRRVYNRKPRVTPSPTKE